MKCHNLCTLKAPPLNHAKLLGLGAKFCIQSRRLDENKFIATMNRFRYDVRVKHFVQTHIGYNNKETPSLHIRNTNYERIPKAPAPIEGAVNRFQKTMLELFRQRNKPRNTNLTRLQQNILCYFQNHPEHTILQADQNLGPCIMNRED